MSTGAKVVIGIGLVVAGFIALALIGNMGNKSAPTAATSSATATSPAAPVPTPTVTVTAKPAPEGTEAANNQPAKDKSPGTSRTFTVPDAVGMNYQRAQDLWRSKGLVVMPAEDATGANRMPWIDSGWVVLGQDPKPGTQAKEGDPIVALVKKYTDD